MGTKRKDHEEPAVVARRGWKYHHIGIPTTVPRPGEQYLGHLKVFVSGFGRSPYGIEWMRFEPGSQVHPLVRTTAHIAFEVSNLEQALKGCALLSDISSPSRGVRAAMIVDDGAPIELIEFSKGRLGTRRTTHRSGGVLRRAFSGDSQPSMVLRAVGDVNVLPEYGNKRPRSPRRRVP